MLNAILLFAALGGAQAETAPAGAFEPAAPADIAAAVANCWAAVGSSGADPQRLGADGWSAVTEPTGKPVESPLEVYFKAGTTTLIMLARAPQASCAVIGRLSSPDEARTAAGLIRQGLLAITPSLKAERSGDGILFISLPRTALVDRLDSDFATEERPGLRIVVGYQNAEKK